MSKIKRVQALEILDSRGNPTVEVEVTVEGGACGRAAVPSGASTGVHEALELRDGDPTRYLGKGVSVAVANVEGPLAEAVRGKDVCDQALIDRLLRKVDGTDKKSNMGANAMLAVSLAAARAAAAFTNQPLYRYLGGEEACMLPTPMCNLLNGGKHVNNKLPPQEFMLVPIDKRVTRFSEALRMVVEVYHVLAKLLEDAGMSTAVGDEGGFGPDVERTRDALELLRSAVTKAGYDYETQFGVALDPASSEFFNAGQYKPDYGTPPMDTQQMIDYWVELCSDFPEILSLEDGLEQDSWEGWIEMTSRLGRRVQLVGDDLFVTSPSLIRDGIAKGAANAVLVKVNQIGTLTEALEAIRIAQAAGYRTVISHRSGETEDTTIADIAVATGAGQIKTGAPCRTDRTCKYNRLLRIERELGDKATFAGASAFAQLN